MGDNNLIIEYNNAHREFEKELLQLQEQENSRSGVFGPEKMLHWLSLFIRKRVHNAQVKKLDAKSGYEVISEIKEELHSRKIKIEFAYKGTVYWQDFIILHLGKEYSMTWPPFRSLHMNRGIKKIKRLLSDYSSDEHELKKAYHTLMTSIEETQNSFTTYHQQKVDTEKNSAFLSALKSCEQLVDDLEDIQKKWHILANDLKNLAEEEKDILYDWLLKIEKSKEKKEKKEKKKRRKKLDYEDFKDFLRKK